MTAPHAALTLMCHSNHAPSAHLYSLHSSNLAHSLWLPSSSISGTFSSCRSQSVLVHGYFVCSRLCR
nr:MAG TPA: hypothetical protein [Caudoviricetes sp.]